MALSLIHIFNPDHYPYAMDKANYDALAGKKLDETFGVYESAAFFYHDGIEPEVIEKYCSSLDLLPTVYNYKMCIRDSNNATKTTSTLILTIVGF